ncbi:hypothetical protein DSM106972_024060 [Dulcicalothrix desertica PCC 7102]|uniref:Uncharacterized protein n=1 Tax=Dulcicalothrix desertica PCC 7102 TaxID=232991 RepID=A0A433VM91_9CYAN|nr:hypothetical protein [Dulcicalothrix desertica]RUT07145.1 hypothetical protein DSM106972_024060 [Dulcicalothrix desertica PCC 7102]
MPVGLPEFVFNPEPRCPVILLLDTSGSMSGQPIKELNDGIMAFKQSIQQDGLASLRVEVAIVTFGESVSVAQNLRHYRPVRSFRLESLRCYSYGRSY